MAGRQAKILSDDQIEELLFFANCTRQPPRNRLIVLLSVKAGLRAAEIANLTWDMVLGPAGAVGNVIELRNWAAKKRSGRIIPIHTDLKAALIDWRAGRPLIGHVIASERGGAMRPLSIVIWFDSGLPCARPNRLLVAFWTADVDHPCSSAGTEGWRVFARRTAACRPSLDSNNPALH